MPQTRARRLEIGPVGHTCTSSARLIDQPIRACRSLTASLHDYLTTAPNRAHLRVGLVDFQSLTGLLALFPESASPKAVAKKRSKFIRTVLLRAAHTMWARRQADKLWEKAKHTTSKQVSILFLVG